MKQIIIAMSIMVMIQLQAQAPQTFNYQAIARDTNGQILINKSISLLVEINDSEGLVYSESHDILTNQLGGINLKIGTGNEIHSHFSDIDWGSDSHYIAISIDENVGNDYVMTGSSQLLSVPYALYAETSATSDSLSNNELLVWTEDESGKIYVKNKDVGIGVESPAYDLDVAGNVNFTGNLYKNGVLYPSSNGTDGIWGESGTHIFYNAGKVSIGTQEYVASTMLVASEDNDSNPYIATFKRLVNGMESSLDICGNPSVASVDSSLMRSIALRVGGETRDLILSAERNDGRVRCFTSSLSEENERLTIDVTGNVGVNTPEPKRSLHVSDVMRLEPRNTPPDSPSEGDIYMNGDLHKLMVFDGTDWQSCW